MCIRDRGGPCQQRPVPDLQGIRRGHDPGLPRDVRRSACAPPPARTDDHRRGSDPRSKWGYCIRGSDALGQPASTPTLARRYPTTLGTTRGASSSEIPVRGECPCHPPDTRDLRGSELAPRTASRRRREPRQHRSRAPDRLTAARSSSHRTTGDRGRLKTNGWKWGFRNTFVYGQWGESYHWDFEGIT